MKVIFAKLLVIFVAVYCYGLFLAYSPFSKGVSPVQYDADIGMWHKINFSGRIVSDCYNVAYHFDSAGRIRPTQRFKPELQDIVMLGDSYLEALMVDNQEIASNVLGDRLKGRFNVLNYGLSGSSPAQQLQLLRKKIDLSRTHMVIQFIHLDSDLFDVQPQRLTRAQRPKVFLRFMSLEDFTVIDPHAYDALEAIRDVLGRSEWLGYIKKSMYHYKVQAAEVVTTISSWLVSTAQAQERQPHQVFNDRWLQLKGAVFQTQRLLRENGIHYRQVVYASVRGEQKTWLAFLDAHNIPYLDLISAFSQQGLNPQNLSFPCDAHWNAVVHRFIGVMLANRFRADDWFD